MQKRYCSSVKKSNWCWSKAQKYLNVCFGAFTESSSSYPLQPFPTKTRSSHRMFDKMLSIFSNGQHFESKYSRSRRQTQLEQNTIFPSQHVISQKTSGPYCVKSQIHTKGTIFLPYRPKKYISAYKTVEAVYHILQYKTWNVTTYFTSNTFWSPARHAAFIISRKCACNINE